MGEQTTRSDELARLLVLPRLRAQPGVLAAVLASILVATTLLAVGPVLATAVAEGGLRANLAEAAPSDIGIEVEVRTTADRATTAVAAVEDVVRAHFGELVDSPDSFITAGTVHLAGQPDDVVTPVAVARRTSDGDLTGDRALLEQVEQIEDPDDGQPVLVHADAAQALDVRPGDVLRIDGGTLARVGAPVVVAGLVAPVDPGDRRWWDSPVGRDGVVPGVDFTQVGPLYVATPQDLESILGDDPPVAVRVRTLPVLDRVTPATLRSLARTADGLGERIDLILQDGDLADNWRVRVPLAGAARAATVSLAATRAAVVATVGQVAVLAIYALGLAGRLLRSGREVETMLVRARGATPRQLGRVAALEGLVLVVPAVLAAPWLATWAVRALVVLGVTEGSALQLAPAASVASLVAATVAGAACLVVLVVPAVTSARRTYAAARSGRGRRDPIGVVQRLGLDLALAAVAGIGIWQLRAAGGPLGSGAPRGPGDVDPVLVAAPALGLLAGALLVLRLVPALARGGESLAGRVRGLVAGLGAWQVARRPDAIARPTLLLVLAVAVGVLAATYGATWRMSQADQADAAVGADLVVAPDRRVTALPDRVTAHTLVADLDVQRARPVWEGPVSLVAGAPGGRIFGLDVTEPLVATRADTEPTVPLAELDVEPVQGLQLPSGDELGLAVTMAPDPAWPDQDAEVTVVVRDGLGLVHRFADREVVAGDNLLTWSLAGVVGPVHMLALDITTQAGDLSGRGYRGPAPAAGEQLPAPELRMEFASPTVDDQPAPPGDGWITDPYDSAAAFPPQHELTRSGPSGWRLEASTGVAGPRGRAATLRVVHPDAASGQDRLVPAVVHPDVLAATGREVGDELELRASGAPLRLALVGTTPLVPGAIEARMPLVVDLDAIAASRWTENRNTTRPSAWYVQLADDLDPTQRAIASQRLAGEWRTPPVAAPQVRSIAADEAARRGDPIAVGLLAALTLGAVAAAALAVLGMVSSAVVGVRERAAEFALLQAVGTSLRQLRWWLTIEVAVVVSVGLVAGTALGAVLVWAVLPTIALASDGTLAVPTPVVVVPVRALAIAVAGVVAVFTLVPIALSRVVARAHVAEVLRLGEDA